MTGFERLLGYVFKQLRGSFCAFLFGLSAAKLVSLFFEKRGIRNLWGATAKRTVVSKSTFEALEWICALIIGFIVFEIANTLLQKGGGGHLERLKLLARRLGTPRALNGPLRSKGDVPDPR